MTSKERMLMTLAHQEADRVPVGEWEYGREIVGPLLHEEPLFGSGLNSATAFWQGRRDEVIAQWKRTLVALTEVFHWDTVLLHLVIGKDTVIPVPEPIGEGRWRDAQGNILTYSAETDRIFMTKMAADAPQPPPPSLDEIAKSPYVAPTESELEIVRYMVRKLGKTHFLFSAPLGGHPQFGFSNAAVSEVENWVHLYEDPDGYRDRSLAGMRSPGALAAIKRVKEEGLDGVATGCDYGCSTGPFMSPELFKKCLQPSLAAFCRMAHDNGLVTLQHACGKNQVLMDMIIEAGVDIYQSIQPEMDIFALKQRYGKRITLWGGVPCGELVLGTPESVRKAAVKCLTACKPGGGYVFATSHSIMPDAKYENYLAMLEAHREFGAYEPKKA